MQKKLPRSSELVLVSCSQGVCFTLTSLYRVGKLAPGFLLN